MFVNVTDKKLFTPGPLSCTQSVKEAMLRDLGSRDREFINIVELVRRKLVDIAGEYYIFARFEVLTAVKVMMLFWIVTPCRLIGRYQS
jgi:aspartate aminotransferase-like enzyme